MKLFSLCLLLWPLYAGADTIVTESTEGIHGNTVTTTIEIKGDKIRMQTFPNVTMILDTSTGEVNTLLHKQQICMVSPASKNQQMKDLIQKIREQTIVGNPKLVDTGTAAKVNNFNTEVYTLPSSNGNVTLWITKDIPNYVELLRKLKVSNTILKHLYASDTNSVDENLGIPVKTQSVTQGEAVTYTILSIEEKPIADFEMLRPVGYKELKSTSSVLY